MKAQLHVKLSSRYGELQHPIATAPGSDLKL